MFKVIETKGESCFTIILDFKGLKLYIGILIELWKKKAWSIDEMWSMWHVMS